MGTDLKINNSHPAGLSTSTWNSPLFVEDIEHYQQSPKDEQQSNREHNYQVQEVSIVCCCNQQENNCIRVSIKPLLTKKHSKPTQCISIQGRNQSSHFLVWCGKMYSESLPDCRWVKQESRHWKALIFHRTVSVWALFSQAILKGLEFLSEQYPIVHLYIHLFFHLLFTLQLLVFRIHMYCTLLPIVQSSVSRKPKRDKDGVAVFWGYTSPTTKYRMSYIGSLGLCSFKI